MKPLRPGLTVALVLATAIAATSRADEPAPKPNVWRLAKQWQHGLRGCAVKPTDPKALAAFEQLIEAGEPAVEPLVARIRSSRRWLDRWRAAYALGLIGPDAKAAVPELEKMVAGEKSHMLERRFARSALAAIRGDAPQLVELIRESNNSWGRYSAELLARMGEEARDVVPQLIELHRQGQYVAQREAASIALRALSPESLRDGGKVRSSR